MRALSLAKLPENNMDEKMAEFKAFQRQLEAETQKQLQSLQAKTQVFNEIQWLKQQLKEREEREETESNKSAEREHFMSLGLGFYTLATVPENGLEKVSILVGADTYVEMSLGEGISFLEARKEQVAEKMQVEKSLVEELHEKIKLVSFTINALKNTVQ